LTVPSDLIRPRRGSRPRPVVPTDVLFFGLAVSADDVDADWAGSMGRVSGPRVG
jgi:hypothetical protein